MRIMHIILTPRYSGAECLVANLAKIHSSWGEVVSVVSLNPCDEAFHEEMRRLLEQGVELAIPSAPLWKIGRILWIHKAVKSFKPDVLFAHSVIPAAYARLALISKRKPSVVSVLHDATQDDYAGAKLRWAEHVLKRRSDGIVAVSALQATNYLRRFKSFPRQQVEAIANGVDAKRLLGERERQQMVREAEQVKDKDGILIIQVGRIAISKNQLKTVQALVPLMKCDPRIKIWFVGHVEEREYAAEVKNLITSMGLSERVILKGARPDIPELMGRADLCVLPSEIEAHSVAMLEALASGVPIVASNIVAFANYRGLGGVYLFDLPCLDDFRLAVSRALENRGIWKRETREFDIEKTASDYISYARKQITA